MISGFPKIPGRSQLLGFMDDLTCPLCHEKKVWAFKNIDNENISLCCDDCNFMITYQDISILRELWKDSMNSYDIAKKHGMLDADEIHLIKACALMLPPNPLIVNIGANVGTSAIAMLENRPDAFIFSIDTRPCPEERENIIACGLDPSRVVRLLGDSAGIGRNFPYQPDLVFVDGAHHDEGVRGDIAAWLPKCKSIMLYHDYHHPRYAEKPGVHLDQIVDEAMAGWERIGEARYLVGFKRK